MVKWSILQYLCQLYSYSYEGIAEFKCEFDSIDDSIF